MNARGEPLPKKIEKNIRMKKFFLFALFSIAFIGSASFAQNPTTPKPVPKPLEGTRIHEFRSEVKREELSKKLMQRKDELRKEEHEHSKERRNTKVEEKTPSQKQ